MARPLWSSFALRVMLSWSVFLSSLPALADGNAPEPRQILLPADRPEQIILATNFGLIISEDDGKTWSFSCERELSNYARAYLLGAQDPHRIFALTNAGLIYSDDDSCGWQAASSSLSDVLLFAFAIDPSSAKRMYAVGAMRDDLGGGDSIYASDDAGLTFGKPAFTSPPRSAILNVLVAPSKPSRLYATLFVTPENHPVLLRSDDSGEHWEEAADLVESFGENPFELLAIDPLDENRVHVKILGPSSETLATSDDGGLSFVSSVSVAGKLNAFLKLQSGTLLVSGTAGLDAVGYRSKDGGKTFEAWVGAPHGHALAERNGKLWVAGDNFSDGYVLAESDDEGDHLTPLAGFKQVQAVQHCVAEVCKESCAYYSGVGLWPQAACGAVSTPPLPDEPVVTDPDTGASAGANATGGEPDGPPEPEPASAGAAGARASVEPPRQIKVRTVGGGCGCELVQRRPVAAWTALLAGSLGVLRLRARGRRRHRTRLS